MLAHNEQTKLESPQTVTATHEHLDPIIVTLKLETSDKKLETITTTPEHPFFALLEPNKKANGIWVNAGELENGNWLRRANGETGIVKSVAFEAKAQKMYNLTVARDHTFFVGDGQWLVHNTWCPTNRLNGDAGEYAIAKDLKDQGFEILSGPDGMGVTGKIGFNVPGVGVRYGGKVRLSHPPFGGKTTRSKSSVVHTLSAIPAAIAGVRS